MISFSFHLILSISRNLTKIRSLVVRSKIDHDLFIITCHFFLILLYTPFDDHVHEIIRFSFFVYFISCLKFFEWWIVKYLPSFFYITDCIPLFRIRKNLLKQSILYSLSIFLFPDGSLNSSRIAWIFYRDWISMSLRISLTEGIDIGGLYFSLFNSELIFYFIASNLLLWNSSNIFLKSEWIIFYVITTDLFGS